MPLRNSSRKVTFGKRLASVLIQHIGWFGLASLDERTDFLSFPCTRLYLTNDPKRSSGEASHGRGAGKFSKLLTRGAQYLTRNMTLKKIARATGPIFPCTSTKTIILVKLSLLMQPLPWDDSGRILYLKRCPRTRTATAPGTKVS